MTDSTLIVGPRATVALARAVLWVFFVVALLVGLACLVWGIVGLIVAVGGVLGQAGTALASGAAASELNGGLHGFWPIAGRFDPTLPVFGPVLIVIGLAFDHGAHLQKDTEGLV